MQARRKCCFRRSALGLRCTTWADRHKFSFSVLSCVARRAYGPSFENMCLLLPVRHRIRKCTTDCGRQFDGGRQMSGHHQLGSRVTFRPHPLRTPSPAVANRLRSDTGISCRLWRSNLEATTAPRCVANYRDGVVHLPFHRRRASPSCFVPDPDLCKLLIGQNLVQAREPRSQSDGQLPSVAQQRILDVSASPPSSMLLAREGGCGVNLFRNTSPWVP